MLRIIFLVLILANLLFFTWTQGYFGTVGDSREPQRLSNQFAPEKLQVVGIEAPSARASQLEQNCRLVSGLALIEAQRLMVQAKDKLPGLRFALKPNEAPTNIYWVYIPPLANKLAVDKKLAELKKRDITDLSVILEEGADKFAISLGLFGTELAAREYLQQLAKRDVKSAKVRVRENQPEKAQLEVRGPAELLVKQLPELLNGQVGATLGDCPAGR